VTWIGAPTIAEADVMQSSVRPDWIGGSASRVVQSEAGADMIVLHFLHVRNSSDS
jgi:hypothetical protein